MTASETTNFSAELVAEIEALKGHYPDPHAVAIPAMILVQEANGCVSDESLVRLSELLQIPVAELLGTMTFYTMLRREPEGRFHVNVCKNISCHLTGSTELREHLEKSLAVKSGETTSDGLFTLGEVECLGACTESPVMEVDGEYHFRVTPEEADRILEEYRRKAGS